MASKQEVSRNEEFAHQFLDNALKNIDLNFSPRVVFPGDDLTAEVSRLTNSVKAGQGIVPQPKKSKISPESDASNSSSTTPDLAIRAATVGVLNHRAPNYYWLDISRKRYYPRVGDQVVGVVEERGGDFYTVNIFSGSHCILNRLAFDGATKRNKPELKRGDVVYAKVIFSAPDADTELSCTGAPGSKKEWSTGETVS